MKNYAVSQLTNYYTAIGNLTKTKKQISPKVKQQQAYYCLLLSIRFENKLFSVNVWNLSLPLPRFTLCPCAVTITFEAHSLIVTWSNSHVYSNVYLIFLEMYSCHIYLTYKHIDDTYRILFKTVYQYIICTVKRIQTYQKCVIYVHIGAWEYA